MVKHTAGIYVSKVCVSLDYFFCIRFNLIFVFTSIKAYCLKVRRQSGTVIKSVESYMGKLLLILNNKHRNNERAYSLWHPNIEIYYNNI